MYLRLPDQVLELGDEGHPVRYCLSVTLSSLFATSLPDHARCVSVTHFRHRCRYERGVGRMGRARRHPCPRYGADPQARGPRLEAG